MILLVFNEFWAKDVYFVVHCLAKTPSNYLLSNTEYPVIILISIL